MFSLCPLWFTLFVVVGCGPRTKQPVHPAGEMPQPFVETVPGSTVTFALRPVRIVPESGGPPHVLWFAETETTWDAYDVYLLRLDENPDNIAFAGALGPDAITRPTHPYAPADRGWGHGGYPVISVTHHAATMYCQWLTRKTGRRYRLPTAAEFRDALFAVTPDGREPGDAADLFWFADDAGETTHPVASKRPSRIGLYDLAGNVAEWCEGDDGKPVVMGGSFQTRRQDMNDPEVCWSGMRQTPAWTVGDPSLPPSKWWLRDAPFVGFRVVCERPPP